MVAMSKIQAVRNRVQAMPTGVKRFRKSATVGAMNTAIDWESGLFSCFSIRAFRDALGALARVLPIPADWFGHSVRPESCHRSSGLPKISLPRHRDDQQFYLEPALDLSHSRA